MNDIPKKKEEILAQENTLLLLFIQPPFPFCEAAQANDKGQGFRVQGCFVA